MGSVVDHGDGSWLVDRSGDRILLPRRVDDLIRVIKRDMFENFFRGNRKTYQQECFIRSFANVWRILGILFNPKQ